MANVMLIAAAMMADVIAVPIPASIQQRAANVGRGGRIGLSRWPSRRTRRSACPSRRVDDSASSGSSR